jgi:hypothetical protein
MDTGMRLAVLIAVLIVAVSVIVFEFVENYHR